MMMRFGKIAIVGVGLLGGSIGQSVKKIKLGSEVVGVFRDKKKIAAAIASGSIDRGTDDFHEAVKGSDLIILCSPISDIINKLDRLKRFGLKDTLITDTGSTKLEICLAARGLNFVGAHPLAGSEQSGIAFARPDLFVGSLCILTPLTRTPKTSFDRVSDFWKRLGSRIAVMSPQKHDHILSLTSHLPHIAAFSLINTIPKEVLSFSAGGLKDTTRIAMSSPELWRDIFFSNKKNMLKTISAFEKSLSALRHALEHNDKQKILSLLKDARVKRSGIDPIS